MCLFPSPPALGVRIASGSCSPSEYSNRRTPPHGKCRESVIFLMVNNLTTHRRFAASGVSSGFTSSTERLFQRAAMMLPSRF